MPETTNHLIIARSKSLSSLYDELLEAHNFLVTSCVSTQKSPHATNLRWGINTKRDYIEFDEKLCPSAIRKSKERLSEIINIVATVERLLGAISWFLKKPEFNDLTVRCCNPSTSSYIAGQSKDNDLILSDETGKNIILCEVCDIASSKAGQNGKEKQELKSLGYSNGEVPVDGKRRFICTSTQFANALTSSKRKKQSYCYTKVWVESATDEISTTILEVTPFYS